MKRIVMLMCVLAFAAAAVGETVYLSDGRQIKGSVKREGNKVIITQENGEVIEVGKADVIYVAGTTKHVDKAEDVDTPAGDGVAANGESAETADVALAGASMPETYVWTYLRRDKPALVDRYRAMAHDRQRRVGTRWLAPDDFIRRRNAYVTQLAKAEKAISEAESLDLDARDADERKRNQQQYNKLLGTGIGQLREAAGMWGDPLMRRILLGMTELQAENFPAAIGHFHYCLKAAPDMAVCHQGLGLAQLKAEQYMDALKSLSTMLTLRPDSSDALAILQDAMEDVPGEYIDRPQYLAAKDLAERCSKLLSRRRSGRRNDEETAWLFPDDVYEVAAHRLPTPDVDRYVVKQAIAVPVGQNTLLVDRQAIADAAVIRVELPDGQFLIADKPRKSRGRRTDESAMPVMLIEVPHAEFTPLVDAEKIDDGEIPAPPAVSESVQVHGVNLLAEMGTAPRLFPTKIVAGEGNGSLAIEGGLAPGEASAPVFDKDGRFLGMQAGKTCTDPAALTDRFYSIADLATILEDVRKPRSSSRRSRSQNENISSDAAFFRIQAIHTERFREDP